VRLINLPSAPKTSDIRIRSILKDRQDVTLRINEISSGFSVTCIKATQVTPQVKKLLLAVSEEMTRGEMQKAMNLSDRENFRKEYLLPVLKQGLMEMTIPDKPKSRNQRYRLTSKGISTKQALIH
jgi:hypothetical protein